MRSAQVIHGIANPSAGPSYSVARLAHGFAALGHESHVFSLAPAPEQWQGGARLSIYDGPLVRAAGLAPALLRDCRRFATRSGILHGHGIWRMTNLFPLALPADAPIRIVCSPRGTFSAWSMGHKAALKGPFWAWLQRPALARVHCFHATAAPEAADVRRLGFHQPVAVIPNGVDIPQLPSIGRRDEVLFLGRIAREKGLDLLLPAWHEIAGAHADWSLRIAGPLAGEHASALRTLAGRLGVARCEFTGELRGAARTDAFARARLFVLPSYTENFGMVVAEALAHGVPVVTTTGTPWSGLAAQRCGWQVAPERAALASALAAALALPRSVLAEMGGRGRAWIEREYGWDSVTARMADTYRWLLEGGTPPPWVEAGGG